MKRALISVIILLTVTATLGAHKTIRLQVDANEPQPLKVTMCNLYEDPQRYAGKLVEFRASAGGTRLDDLWLDDFGGPTCDAYMRIVAVFPEQVTPKPSFSFIGNEAFRQFVSSIRSMRVEANFSGRFDPGFVWREKKRIRIADVAGLRDKDYDARIVVQTISEIIARRLPRR